MNDQTKNVTIGDEVHAHTLEAVEIMERAVGSTYGPGGRPVRISKRYVDPMFSTDGVTVARNIAGHGARLKNNEVTDVAKLIHQASEKTNKTAGDGTTATVVLLAEIYKAGYKQVAAGVDAMIVKRQIHAARDKVVEFVNSKSLTCDKKKLDQVAITSGKDEKLGRMISDLVWDVGADGAITIEYQNAPHIEVEKVTGYLFGNGFRHLANNEVELTDPLVFVTQKAMRSRADIIPILERSVEANRQFLIIGDVTGAALETLVWAIQNQKADGLAIPPPAYGADGHEYFEDIAAYTGAQLILEGDSFKDVTVEHSGTIKKARIGRDKATVYGDNDVTGKAITERISVIREQMEKREMTPSLKETLEQRLAKLAGKVSIIKVGAPTEAEREELFFRVEDAVEACKSAMSSGVVAGGATTLLFASEQTGDGISFDAGGTKAFERQPVLEQFVKDALQQPFRLLMSNAAEDGGYRLNQVLNAGYGKGFNLREMTDEPIDLIETGTVDATKVVTQTVVNAFSVAAELVSQGGSISEEPEDEKA
jgi:chaperonin GroEL